VKIKLTGLTVAAGILAPMAVLAAPDKGPNVMYVVTNGDPADIDAKTKDLDAQLADARARLEEAAHEVAEISSQMSGPLVDHMMSIYQDGPPHAVLGVQLDERSGKDGARVQEVSPGGPAAEAGLRTGDVITSINGADVKGDHTARQVMHAMRDVGPDSKVKLRVLRAGKSQDFVVTARPGMAFRMHPMPSFPPIPPIPPIPPMPPDPPGHDGGERFGPVFIRGPLGEMELVSLTPQLGKYFGTDKGVLVVRAPKDFKLEDGDVILAIDGREPTSGSHATRILGSYQPGEKIAIKVMRQQKTVNVETTLPERGRLGRPGRESRDGRDGPEDKVRLERRVAGNEAAT
jgi:membrane-associated protease RseP (regulator of RpoE activity)